MTLTYSAIGHELVTRATSERERNHITQRFARGGFTCVKPEPTPAPSARAAFAALLNEES